MRNCLIILLFSVSLFHYANGQKKMQVSAVAFYNFENLFDTLDDKRSWSDDEFLPSGLYKYTGAVYSQKLHNLATVISQLATDVTPDGPAIIGTAEIENSKVLSDLTAQPEIRGRYRFVHFDSRDSRGIDVAMLYNPNYFRVFHARALYVDISKIGEIKEGTTRDVLYVNGLFAGDTLHLLINHWPSRRGGETASAPLRVAAARVCKNIIDSLTNRNTDARIIVMGDLNDDPINESVSEVLGAKGNTEQVSATGLYNPWVSYYKKGYGTLGYDDCWNLFDQIILSGAFLKPYHHDPKKWKYYKSEIFRRDFLMEKFGRHKGYPKRSFSNDQWNSGYSDHLPTIIYFVRPL